MSKMHYFSNKIFKKSPNFRFWWATWSCAICPNYGFSNWLW